MPPDSQDDEDLPRTPPQKSRTPQDGDQSEESRNSSDNEEEEEDEEPRLKYATLTKGQGMVYRNGDAVSAFLVAGDKMVIGTHNGIVHVFSLPSFDTLRVYRAHTASISAISISPFPPPLPTKPDISPRVEHQHVPRNSSSPSGKSQRQPPVPNTPANAIYIATSSIDGNVHVCSLVDPDDVILRKFGRPIQGVAVSPDYKNDRSYVSGGKAGNLVLTVGGQVGRSSVSNTDPHASMASGWLGAIGLGGSNGTDTVLHSGEGNISTIKWSLSGRFLVWVNEYGIKIMRTNLHLESNEVDYAWKRISHTDRRSGPIWDEMAGAWTARAEWVDEDGLEIDDYDTPTAGLGPQNGAEVETQSVRSVTSARPKPVELKQEKLVVGWGDCVWIFIVTDGLRGAGKDRRMGKADIIKFFQLDCIVSGVSLYTPDLLIILAYVTPEENESKKAVTAQGTPRRGITRRQNALKPEMMIVDINSKSEIVADTLKVSRFESLTATDYHLGILPVIRATTKTSTARGALEVLGNFGGTVWDASMYSTKLLSSAAIDATLYSANLFKSGASVRSIGSDRNSKSASTKDSDVFTTSTKPRPVPHPALLTRGMKIFIQSPYDCVLATKPTRADHIAWLMDHEMYEEAWTELDTYPEAVSGMPERTPLASIPGTPTKPQGSNTLYDFFDDSSSSVATKKKTNFYSQSEKEKRRIGDKWIQRLVNAKDWVAAAQVCGKVVGTSHSWEHWASVFADAGQHAEIAPYIPTEPLQPPLPSWVYEIMLGNFISRDRPKLAELLDRWPPDLFDVKSVISAIQSKFQTGEVTKNTVEDGSQGKDWRILTDSLAKLYLADGRTRDALKCYISLQDADVALALIRTHHLVDAVADDIPGLLLLRVSHEQLMEKSLHDLEEASIEPIRLLVSEAHHGVVKPDDVVKQLQARQDMQPFLFLYFRALWNGDTADDPNTKKRTVRDATIHHLATEGKALVNDFADTALRLFAEYDRDLLFEFLKTSQSYTLSLASSICESKNYTDEYVFVLSKEGRTKEALFIIIEKLADVSRAISFAKEQDDPELWDDLLTYSMNKPAFIRALLEEVGTAIDPITLVRRIPTGLEIDGLRGSVTRMLREYELQYSISDGVARVFRGEVAAGMSALRAGQKRGVRFDIISKHHAASRPGTPNTEHKSRRRISAQDIKAGHCAGCGQVLVESPFFDPSDGDAELEPLLSFPCAHVFHLGCFMRYDMPAFSRPAPVVSANEGHAIDGSAGEDEDELRLPPLGPARDVLERGVGAKVTYAEALSAKVGEGGCPVEVHRVERQDADW